MGSPYESEKEMLLKSDGKVVNDEMQIPECESSVSTAISLQHSALDDTSAGHSPTRNPDLVPSTTHVARFHTWKNSNTKKNTPVSSRTGVSVDRLKLPGRNRQLSDHVSTALLETRLVTKSPSIQPKESNEGLGDVESQPIVSQRPSLITLKKGALFGRSKTYKMQCLVNDIILNNHANNDPSSQDEAEEEKCACNDGKSNVEKRPLLLIGSIGKPEVHIEKIEKETNSQVRIKLRVYAPIGNYKNGRIVGWMPSKMTLQKVDITPVNEKK